MEEAEMIEAFKKYARGLAELLDEYGDIMSVDPLDHADLIEELHEEASRLGFNVEYVVDDYAKADDYEFYGERYKVTSNFGRVWLVKVKVAKSLWTGKHEPCEILIEEG